MLIAEVYAISLGRMFESNIVSSRAKDKVGWPTHAETAVAKVITFGLTCPREDSHHRSPHLRSHHPFKLLEGQAPIMSTGAQGCAKTSVD